MAGTITSLGLGSGIDLQGTLEKLKAVDQVPITNMKTRQLQYKDQIAEFQTVNTKLLALKTAALDLTLNSTYDSKSVASTNADVAGATLDSSAAEGNYNVVVTALAKQNIWQSSGVASSGSAISSTSGNFRFTAGDTQVEVDVTPGMTLQQLADAINEDEANTGVIASVMNDGTGTDAYHLVLTAKETGEINAITIVSNTTSLTMSEAQAKGTLDAKLSVNGIGYQRATNNIDDVLTGMHLNLIDTGSATLRVSSDTGGIKEKITALVNAYNEAVQEIKDNSSYDPETGQRGSLNGISTFVNIRSSLRSLVSSTVSGLSGSYSSLSDIGIQYNRDGTLSLDEEALGRAIDSNLDAVQELLIGNEEKEIDGIAARLNKELRYLTKATDGPIANEINRAQATVDRLDDQVESATERLNKRYETLSRTFAQLDQVMARLQSEGNYLAAQFESYNNASKN